MENQVCYHCGDTCGKYSIYHDGKDFCCHGCKTVYSIFTENGLDQFYELEARAGSSPFENQEKYEFLDNQEIVSKLVSFNEDEIQVVELSIPTIHCSSCIWLLENLNRLHPSIINSQVDFPKKRIRVTYNLNDISLKTLVLLLGSIGYEP